jgi:hypothetical protein
VNTNGSQQRIRTPIKGLRQKVRIALREAGVTGKLTTDVLRNGDIVVASEHDSIELTSYEGRMIIHRKV